MAQRSDQYDTSNYPPDHFLHSLANKKVLGKITDECTGTPTAEFHGLVPAKNVFHPEGRQQTGAAIQRGKEMSGEKVHPTRTVQGGALRSKYAQTQHECIEEPDVPHIRPACNQNLAITPRLKTLD